VKNSRQVVIFFDAFPDHLPSISKHFPNIHFYPQKYVDLKMRLLLTATGRIYSLFVAKSTEDWGIKPILAMPGFW